MIGIDLSGKAILITGALGAIAKSVIRRLIEAGATLVLVDILPEEQGLPTLHQWEIPSSAFKYISADVTDSANVDHAVSKAFEWFPGLDTVLGHAGGCGLHPFATTSEAEYEQIFQFNYFAQTYLARAVLSQWTHRQIIGHLIFTSSYVARIPHSGISSYASAKAALENFARSLALEYAHTGTRINVISPGNVAAGSAQKAFDQDPLYREFVLRVSLGRRNSPESIADMFVFMCSSLAREINGQVMSPDYGGGVGNRL